MPFTVLITGARSGIGMVLVGAYLKQANTTVIAGVRDTADTLGLQALKTLPIGANSELVIVQLRSESDSDPKTVADHLKAKGFSAIDIVIANAATRSGEGKMAALDPVKLREHFNVNTIGPITLFTTFLPFLRAAEDPKFVVIGSMMSTSIFPAMKLGHEHGPYALSKAAVNFALLHIHHEHPEITALLVHPGIVATEKALTAAAAAGADLYAFGAISPEQAADNIVEFVAATSKGSADAGHMVDTSKGLPVSAYPF